MKIFRVPDARGNSILLPQQHSATSISSINSNKGSNMNLRDGSPNFRMPWKIIVLGDAGVGKTSIVNLIFNLHF